MTRQRLTLRQVVSEFCFFGDRVEALEAINKLIRAAHAEGLAEAEALKAELAQAQEAAREHASELYATVPALRERVAALEKQLSGRDKEWAEAVVQDCASRTNSLLRTDAYLRLKQPLQDLLDAAARSAPKSAPADPE